MIQAHTTHTQEQRYSASTGCHSLKEVACAGVETQPPRTHTHTQVVVSEGEKVLNGFLSLSKLQLTSMMK